MVIGALRRGRASGVYGQQPAYDQQAEAAAAGFGFMIGMVFVIACGIGVYIDARTIGARKGLIPGFTDLGPFGWAISTVLLWIIAFPLYLAQRSKIKQAALQRANPRAYAQAQQPSGWAQANWQAQSWSQNPPSVLPPANWYEDPQQPSYNRWWDGHQWTEHRTRKPF
jgi:hypothetical protein